MDRLPVSKRATQKFDMKRFNLKKLKEAEVKEEYQLQISNRFAESEN
jgi:hypothetical protein